MAEPDRIGVDTGGTFTDVVCCTRDGSLRLYKVLSTPHDPSEAIAAGVAHVEDVAFTLVHGTTVATNAILERKGARVAFVTTRGFEDLLELRRQRRPDLYALHIERVPHVVPAGLSFGVDERVYFDGAVGIALTHTALDDLETWLVETQPDAVAICLLHAYANPEHERLVEARIRQALPSVFVSVSHQVHNQFREYERATTTAVNAFVGPTMSSYLSRLEDRVGHATSIDVLQSYGGRADIAYTSRLPVHTALSGPAGGVVGALAVAEQVGVDAIITFDMGGTSTDVSLCEGELTWTSEAEIDGLPIHVPVVDIVTVGAGGGSIARIDRGGVLHVGPESAGASPGPAAYLKGGDEPTVTDAHVALGRLRPDRFLGGQMVLGEAEATTAVARLADSLDSTVEEAAHMVLEVANASMVRAIKVTSVERGHDPRDFTLVSFGGAGGLHACDLATELDIPRVIIPRMPGLLSAYGMLHARQVRVVGRTILGLLDEILASSEGMRAILNALSVQLETEMPSRHEVIVEVDLRYQGQSYEIAIPTDWAPHDVSFRSPLAAFEAAHTRLYGYLPTGRGVELVNIRLIGRSSPTEPVVASLDHEPGEAEVVSAWFANGWTETHVYDRANLEVGQAYEGPMIVAEYSGTTVIPPGWTAHVHPNGGHLILEQR